MLRPDADLPVSEKGRRRRTIGGEIVDRLTYSTGKDPKSPSRMTGWRQPSWWCATASSTTGWNRPAGAYRQRCQAGLLSLARIPDRPADARCHVQSRAAAANCSRRWRSWASISTCLSALEPDAALGNGGLGRLAACFMESMASVDIPAYGYGIRYQHGLFRQEIADGWQVELPETWLEHGNPWEFERRESAYEIGFGGAVERPRARIRTASRYVWKPAERVIAIAYDTPIVGWRGQARQHAAAVEGAADRPDPARRLQRRRPYRRAGGEQPRRSADARALSGRLDARRAGTAAAAGVLLLLGLAAGHPAPAHAAISTRWTTSPTRWRSSSTTPIRRSRSPS